VGSFILIRCEMCLLMHVVLRFYALVIVVVIGIVIGIVIVIVIIHLP
jgi:hypothetical protein